jgi:hypothetical protein
VPTKGDYDTSAAWTQQDLQATLVKLGFRPTIDQPTLITAFQRHFQPEVFKTPTEVGIADAEGKARLACLVRRKTISDAMRRRSTGKRSSSTRRRKR